MSTGNGHRLTLTVYTQLDIWIWHLDNGYVHCSESTNPIDLDLERFVTGDRSSPMKQNTFVTSNAMLLP